MLTVLRRGAESFIARILFVVLILSFAIWGIGSDMIRSITAPDTTVARFSGGTVTLDEALPEFRREIQQLDRQFGGRLETTEPIRRAIAEQVALRLASGRAIDLEAARMGLLVGDDALRSTVFTLPAFAGPDGRFSRPFFDNFLRSQGLTEPRFFAILRADLARQVLVTAARAGAAAPPSLAAGVLAFVGEVRIADIATIEADALPPPPAPEEATLRRWYDTHPEDFSAPETRAITVAVLGPDQLAGGIEVTDADVAAAFAARRGEFEQAETREIDQLLVPDESVAGVLAAQWRLGAAWETMAQRAREAGGTAVRLGTLARTGLPIPAVAEAAFGLAEPGVADPVRTPFGFSVLRVNRITAGRAATIEDVQDQLRAGLARERAVDLVYARERRAEDALAGGMRLPELAQEFGMALAKFDSLDREGRDEAGLVADLGPARAIGPKLLEAAFSVGSSAEPRMIEAEGGVFFAVKVDAVTPAATRPFESVRDAVLAAWAQDARGRIAEEKATALMTAARAPGATLASAAEAAGVAVRRSGPIQRPNPQAPRAELSPEAANAVFGLAQPGEVTMVRVPGGYAVLALAEIRPAAPDEATLAAFRSRVSQAVGEDVEQVFVDTLRARAGVTLSPRGLEMLAQP